MKIAIVLNTSWNIYNFRKGLIQSFLDKDNEVFTIAPTDAYSNKLTEMGCHHIPVKMDSRGASPLKDFMLIFELFWIYKKVRPDVILHYTIKPNIYGTIAASLLKIPVINNVCGLGTIFLKDNFVSKVAIALYRIAFRFPRKIFFQNNDDKELFINKKIVNPKICDLVPGSGIDVRNFNPQMKAGEKSFTFLLISRLIYDKGILEYIEAIKKLKSVGYDAKFQILGAIDEKHKRGIPKKIIDSWIDSRQIEYLGTTTDVKEMIKNADCIVLPSYREGTPRTLLEAASMEKPIVTTNVPGCKEVVKDGFNGYLCNLKDADDLADKMKNILSLDPDLLQQMGKNSREYVKTKFDERIVIRKYHESISTIN